MDQEKYPIDTIMIFAAGYGKRMQHLTIASPKPLIPILGTPILHYVLQLVLTYPFKRIVINTHYCHQQIVDSINEFKLQHIVNAEIILIHEPYLLETGGGIKNAYLALGNKPIFTCNSDVIIQSPHNIFDLLVLSWDSAKMNFLLAMQPYETAVGYKGNGDFELLANGKLSRVKTREHYSYIYSGISILKPDFINNNPLQVFSLREYYLNDQLVYGVVIPECKWYHATTPDDVVDIESTLHVR